MSHPVFFSILLVSTVCLVSGFAVVIPFLVAEWRQQRRRLVRALDRKRGLFLAVGATGAGKSNTFWAGIEAMERESRRKWLLRRAQICLHGTHVPVMIAWFVYGCAHPGFFPALWNLCAAAISALSCWLLVRRRF